MSSSLGVSDVVPVDGPMVHVSGFIVTLIAAPFFSVVGLTGITTGSWPVAGTVACEAGVTLTPLTVSVAAVIAICVWFAAPAAPMSAPGMVAETVGVSVKV